MRLAHYDFETVFEISPDRVNVLVVESEEHYFQYCAELSAQIAGGEGNFCLSEGEAILPLSKAGLLTSDYLSLQVNEKKFTTKPYRSLQEVAERSCLQELQQLSTVFADFFVKLNAQSDCPLDYDAECGLEPILKAFGVCFEEGASLLENIVLYMRAHSVFVRTRCFFWVGLKSVLSERQLAQLYHEAELLEVNLFLLENVQKPRLSEEIVTVIDRDLCEFIAN